MAIIGLNAPDPTVASAAPAQTTPQVTTTQFANSVRTTYPNGIAKDGTPYAKMSDQDLVHRVVNAHPVYAPQISDYKGVVPGSTITNAQSTEPDLGTLTGNEQVAGVKQAASGANQAASAFNNNSNKNGLDTASQTIKKTGDLLHGGAQAVIGIGRSVFAPFTAAIQDAINNSSDKPEMQALATSKPVSDFLDAVQKGSSNAGSLWDKVEAAHPDIARTISDSLGVATTVAGAEGGDVIPKPSVSEGIDSIKSGVQAVKQGVGDAIPVVKDTVTSGVQGIKAARAAKIQAAVKAQADARLQTAINDTTPAYHKSLISEPDVNGVPRVQEGRGLSSRTVTSTALEKQAGAELAKTPSYDPNSTNLTKYQTIKPQIAAKAKSLETALAKENILRPPKELLGLIKKATDKVSKESLLLQKSDPVIKQYLRVAGNTVKQVPGNVLGELKLRQALDNTYENARGGAAFNSDRIAALDEIHRSARGALTKDLIAKAKKTPVEKMLKSEWDLYRAAEVLRNKAEVEGNSKIEQLMNKHPAAARIGKSAVRAAGLGAGLHLIP